MAKYTENQRRVLDAIGNGSELRFIDYREGDFRGYWLKKGAVFSRVNGSTARSLIDRGVLVEKDSDNNPVAKERVFGVPTSTQKGAV